MGFYPQIKNLDYAYFNLQEGLFETRNTLTSIQDKKIMIFKALLGINFDDMQTLKLNKMQRQQLLEVLISYFELHLPGFKNLKSLPILQSVFN